MRRRGHMRAANYQQREREREENRSLTICLSLPDPLLYVEVRVEEQASAYHGMLSNSLADPTEMV